MVDQFDPNGKASFLSASVSDKGERHTSGWRRQLRTNVEKQELRRKRPREGGVWGSRRQRKRQKHKGAMERTEKG